MKRLRELLEQLTLHFQVEIAIADVLESNEKEIKKLQEENLKYKVKFDSLEKRYSDLLLVIKEINKKLPNF